jgi:hypothetical protein
MRSLCQPALIELCEIKDALVNPSAITPFSLKYYVFAMG